jgi:flagellar basal body P-ring protein FlgI
MQRAGLCLGILLLSLVGCSTEQFRLQSSDDDKSEKPLDVKTVGSVTSIYGVQPVRVFGVGVVYGLSEKGGATKPGPLRQQGIRLLKEMGCKDPVAFLAQPDVAVVRVAAILPPGIQKGEPVDVDVEVDPGDPVPSLRGGTLLECELSEYADKQQLRGGEGPRGDLKGHVLVKAQGPLLVGLGEIGDKNRERRGRIWGGGKCLVDRNFGLILNKDSKDARTAKLVADRINERFYGPFRGTMRGMAEAKTDNLVTLRIPHQYKNNWPRYLRVVRQLPLRENTSRRNQYARQLGEQLLDPAMTVVAALKLEALGTEAISSLKRGLEQESPLVRFTAAEALAYLGEPCCAEPLAQLIEQDPRLRAYGLTALASLDESVCHIQLRRLLAADSAETRYGAFRALRTLDDRDQAIPGMPISDFHLHRAAPDSKPMIHIATTRRAELVLFGDEQALLPPFALQAGHDFLVTAREGEETCKVARISARSTPLKEECSLKVDEVVRKLGAMGATYADVVELLQQADQRQNLTCRVLVDAVPQAPSVYALVNQGAALAFEADADEDADNAVDLGMTPNLFSQPGRRAAKLTSPDR